MDKPILFSDGQEFRGPYPFCRDSGIWLQGPRFSGEDGFEADALGEQVLTVVSVHQPGDYMPRVFFNRVLIDPDGKQYSRRACQVETVNVFSKMIGGYRRLADLGFDIGALPASREG